QQRISKYESLQVFIPLSRVLWLVSGNKGSLPRYMIITHLAIHGGFHRGFIGDMFGQIPVIPAGQDIPVWEQAMRQG
ncbi:MAG: hypothetical protein O2817_12320, partial [Proteobacteria bacterium]|nr:hypothetical protein [Pseudomonadota bacterium]